MILWKKKVRVLDPREGYALWAPSYREEKNPIKANSDLLVEKWFPGVNGKSVLDAGCGPGKYCNLAEHRGATDVTGTDISEEMIAMARRDCKRTEFVIADLATSALPRDRFDVAICALVLGHCERFEDALLNLCLSIRLHGIVILTDFHPELSRNNAKRTFQDNVSGDTFEIRHFIHPVSQYRNFLTKWGFEVQAFEEPQWQNAPVIFGIKAQRII